MWKRIAIFVLCLSVLILTTGCEEKLSEAEKDRIARQLAEDLVEEYKDEILLAQIENAKQKLIIQSEDTEFEVKNDYCYVAGSVKNVSEETITYYEVKCDFLNSDGYVMDSDFTNSGQDLLPNESRKFEIMHRWDKKFDSYAVSVGEVKTK